MHEERIQAFTLGVGTFLGHYSIILCCLGLNATTHKVHLLSHAVACVRWGPLWAYSTFDFEGMNHQVKKLFHGSQDMNKQVCN